MRELEGERREEVMINGIVCVELGAGSLGQRLGYHISTFYISSPILI